jgi:hypothetical protein
MLRSAREARAVLRTMRAEARVEYRSKGRRIRFQAWILAEHPDRFFMEAGGFGISASLVSAVSGDMQVFIPAKSRYFRGPTADGLKALFGLNLSDTDWVELLLEGMPELGRVVKTVNAGKYRKITAESGARLLELTVDPANGWLNSIEYRNGPPLTVKFGKPMETSSGSYPSTVRFSTPEGSLTLEFQKVEPNPELKPELFQLSVPTGTESFPLGSARDLIDR